MPKQRYQRQEPTHAWEQMRPKLTGSAQMTYEITCPVILWGETPKERTAETGMSTGMASLISCCIESENWQATRRSLTFFRTH